MVDKSYNDLPTGEVQVSNVFPFNDGIPNTLQDTFDHIEDLTLHTGVREGLFLSVNGGDNTKFDIAAGEAIIINRDPDPRNSVVTRITFPQTLAITDTNLGDTFSHVYMDNLGVITTETTFPTLSDIHDRIHIGQLIHAGGVIITVLDNPIVAQGISSTKMGEIVFGGGITLDGGIVTANGANLKLDITTTKLEQFGRGFKIDANTPNILEPAAQSPIPVPNFGKVFADGSNVLQLDLSTNDMDPTLFNSGGLGTLVAVSPSNNYTTVRVFYAGLPGTTSRLILYYGTEQFSSSADALEAAEPTFVEHEETRQLSPVAKIAIKGNVTDIATAIGNGDAVIQMVTRRT